MKKYLVEVGVGKISRWAFSLEEAEAAKQAFQKIYGDATIHITEFVSAGEAN